MFERVEKKCLVCGEYIPLNGVGSNNRKYCVVCSVVVQEEKSKQQARITNIVRKQIFDSLPEKEKLRRMKLISQKILEDDSIVYERRMTKERKKFLYKE